VLVEADDINNDQVTSYWCIDLDWYEKSNRSFISLASERLCPECRKRYNRDNNQVSANELLASIKDCCSKKPGFIAADQPIMESVFRLFLSNSNQPLEMAELSRQLGEWRGGTSQRTSIGILSRLLQGDHHYGIRQVAG
jgi:hypothetical protein